jgi:hypothetical protein
MKMPKAAIRRDQRLEIPVYCVESPHPRALLEG